MNTLLRILMQGDSEYIKNTTFSNLANRGFSWRPCRRAETIKQFCMKIDLISQGEEPYRCVIIGCLLIDLVMLIDTYHSIIVRFALPTTRGFFHHFYFSLVSSLHSRRKPLGPGYTKCNTLESHHEEEILEIYIYILFNHLVINTTFLFLNAPFE